MLLNVFIIQLKDSSAAMCKKSETSATHRNHLKVVETVSFTECALCVHQNSARRASQLHSQDSGWSVNPSDGFGINKLYKHNSFISPTTILTIILTIKLEPYIYHLSLSLHLNGHFPDGSGWASTRMSPFWILLQLRMTKVVVTAGAISRAKLQSNHHHQQTNIQLVVKRLTHKVR